MRNRSQKNSRNVTFGTHCWTKQERLASLQANAFRLEDQTPRRAPLSEGSADMFIHCMVALQGHSWGRACVHYIYIYIIKYIIRVFRMILRNSTVTPRNGIYKHWPKNFLFLLDQEPLCWKNSHTSLICVVSWHCCHLRSEAMQGCNVRNEGNHAVTSCSSSSNHCSEEKKSWKSKEHGCWLDGCKRFCFFLKLHCDSPRGQDFNPRRLFDSAKVRWLQSSWLHHLRISTQGLSRDAWRWGMGWVVDFLCWFSKVNRCL